MTVLFLYTVVTLVPFYFLAIRSIVPTAKASQLHVWFPALEDFDMESGYGNTATFYNLRIEEFKSRMGIGDEYISPNETFAGIAEKYGVPKEKILRYMNPYVKYNGWLTILTDSRFPRSMLATTLITAASLATGGFLSTATASVLAGFRQRWHLTVFRTYMLSMIIPPIMIILPLYIIMGKGLNLAGTYWPLYLLDIKGDALSTMVFTSYISTIPFELKESVDADGGNRFHYFFRVLLPLTKVPFASYIAIRFPRFWNDLLFGLLFLKPENYTLTPLIYSYQGVFTTNYQAIYAGLAVAVLPVLVLYFGFQRLFVRAALSGAIKA
jgi:ABC-type glycerol-3-phosphate transport system permease component